MGGGLDESEPMAVVGPQLPKGRVPGQTSSAVGELVDSKNHPWADPTAPFTVILAYCSAR